MQPRSLYGKQTYNVRLPPEFDSEESDLSDSDDEYFPPPKNNACPPVYSSDDSDDSDNQPSTPDSIWNEVHATSQMSLGKEAPAQKNVAGPRRII